MALKYIAQFAKAKLITSAQKTVKKYKPLSPNRLSTIEFNSLSNFSRWF